MKKIYALISCALFFLTAGSQYISRSQPVPFNCPSVCPGSQIELEVFQVQNLNVGDTLLVWLSNPSGSFNSGTTTITPDSFSLNGTTWTSGPYLFSSNINNLYLIITIPAGVTPGDSFTILMETSSGFVASDYFSCSGTNYIAATPAYATLPSLPPNVEGTGYWNASVFTWVPDTDVLLTTPALVAMQDFYDTANYKGYFIKDSLAFDINFYAFGGSCPGPPGILNDGTSIPCYEGFQSDFSIRLKRKENFAAGRYRLAIDGDDGIRLSINGGDTWILSSFLEQVYADGFQSTDSLYPGGVCLSGPVDLVIEYFQYPNLMQLSFTCTQLSSLSVGNAGNQSTCAGGNVTFNLSGPDSLTYQWYYSADSGSTFNPVTDNSNFSGANSSSLGVSNVPSSFNDYLFQCSITGICGNAVNTPVDTLFVGGSGQQVTISANKTKICPSDSATICAPEGAASYIWNTGQTTACITTQNAGNYYVTVTYSGGCSSTSNHVAISVYPAISISISQSGDTLRIYSGRTWQWYNGDNPISGATDSLYLVSTPGTYSVLVTDSNGCTAQSNPLKIIPGDLNTITGEAAFNIYPNPVSGNCLVSVNNINPALNPLKIFDALGRLVMQVKIETPNTEVDMSRLAAGMYFCRLGNLVKKVIKE
jgi:hypothetical protein